MKQIYQRALKAASDFGYQKESPEEAPYHVYMSCDPSDP
jgi:hypothetical protein